MKYSTAVIADDNPFILAMIKTVLDRRCEVIAACADGAALVEQVKQLNPDLVVTDIEMPVLDGFDAAVKIKQVAPSSKIIFYTGKTGVGPAQKALNNGANGYVLKSDDLHVLVEAIDYVIDGEQYISEEIKGALEMDASATALR